MNKHSFSGLNNRNLTLTTKEAGRAANMGSWAAGLVEMYFHWQQKISTPKTHWKGKNKEQNLHCILLSTRVKQLWYKICGMFPIKENTMKQNDILSAWKEASVLL